MKHYKAPWSTSATVPSATAPDMCLAFTFILTLLLLCCASAAPAQSNNVFSLSYNDAGLTRVQVRDGRLVYTWHTLRKWGNGQPVAVQQDMSSYDRHEATIWLTSQEMNGFQRWAETNHLSRFHSPFPARAGKPSYGAAFQTTLTVAKGAARQNLAWNGDSQVPTELTAAVQALVHLCAHIEEQRRN